LEHTHQVGELESCFGGYVHRSGTAWFGADLQDAGPFEFAQAFREQATRESRRAVGDLVERPASEDDDVAEDDDRPSLGEYL
jgi:hypothetical protein